MDKVDLRKAYEGKKVFITGITGFKGGWMTLMLRYLGASVSGIGLEPEDDNSIFYAAHIDEIADVTIGDITAPADESELITAIMKADPDYIFHMAAQPIVSIGYKNPFHTFHTNIMGTVVMHEIVRGLGANKKLSFVNVTTDKVYAESLEALKENDWLCGHDPYSLSKSCSDMISECYSRSYPNDNVAISVVRAGNVIGGGDMAKNRIIPDVVRSVISSEPLQVRCPDSVRPYQHVFDAINAYLVIAAMQYDNSACADAYNVGPVNTAAMKTEELVNTLQTDMDFKWESGGESIGHENSYLTLDVEKILTHTPWRPVFDTNGKICSAVAEWYNSFIDSQQMQAVTLQQIKEAYGIYESY